MTEKDYNPERRNKKVLVDAPKKLQANQIQQKEKIIENKEEKIENSDEKKETEIKTEEKKKPIQKKPVVKKTEAVVNGNDLRISTKVASDVCRFIKYKKISEAIADLEEVLMKKKAVPMRGEIPHRRGQIMAGRFPQNASKEFIRLLKTLIGNSIVNGLENPVIVETVANIASRPHGRFGRFKKKRTHVKIVAKEKAIKGEKK